MNRQDKDNNTEIEEFRLDIPPTAFNMDSNRSSLNTRPARYNRELAELSCEIGRAHV